MLGLHCCMGFSLVSVNRGYSLVAVLGLLTAVASPATEHGLLGVQAGFSNCGSWALEHRRNSCGTQA